MSDKALLAAIEAFAKSPPAFAQADKKGKFPMAAMEMSADGASMDIVPLTHACTTENFEKIKALLTALTEWRVTHSPLSEPASAGRSRHRPIPCQPPDVPGRQFVWETLAVSADSEQHWSRQGILLKAMTAAHYDHHYGPGAFDQITYRSGWRGTTTDRWGRRSTRGLPLQAGEVALTGSVRPSPWLIGLAVVVCLGLAVMVIAR